MKRGKEKADKDKDPHAPRKPPSAGRRQRGSQEKPDWPKRLLGLGFLFVIGGPGVVTVLSYFGGTGVAHLDVHDTAKLKSVLFSGEPWLVYCVNNDTQSQRLPKVLEDSAGPLRSNLGLAVGVLQCWDKTESGRSVAQRFKLSASPPLSFLVANGNKPRVVSLVGARQPEDLEKKLKPALALETPRIDTLKKWSTLCTSRRACVVVGHKNTAQRDTALNLVRPNLERYRALKVVTLDTSFWQLKLDKAIALARLDGSMHKWLTEHCPHGNELLPSVRSGLEMALLHVLGRAAGEPHLGSMASAARRLGCSSHIGINALLAREEDLDGPLNGVTVVKVKVGRDPEEDALRTSRLAEQLGNQGVRLRLDANQAWTVDGAAAFIGGLSDRAVSLIDYLEEPVQWSGSPQSFFDSWGELAARTGSRVRFAVDESLTERPVRLEDIAACKAPVAALVLKPALQGLEQTVACAEWALAHGAQAVLSSAFESGVALCHYSILAAILALPPWSQEGGVLPCHGLGTFTRLAEDVLCPPFADLVRTDCTEGWRVDALSCQAALNRSADSLV